MDQLNCHVVTFNCGRAEVDVEYFALSLRTSFSSSASPPDFVVLALEEIAPIGYSFLGQSLLEPYLSKLRTATQDALRSQYGDGADHHEVLFRNVGMIAVLVFARVGVSKAIRWVDEAGVGTGFWNMGNKGAVGVRIAVDPNALQGGPTSDADEEETILTFIAAHLAPMEDAWIRRNEDWKQICQELVFLPVDAKHIKAHSKSKSNNTQEAEPLLLSDNHPTTRSTTAQLQSIFNPPSYIFFAGDLNYRTSDHPPGKSDYKNWPQPMAPETDSNHFVRLFKHDQLQRELAKGATLHHLAEAKIDFPPTYKYSSRAQKLAQQDAARHISLRGDHSHGDRTDTTLNDIQEQVWLWAKHRIPSWCDRILFSAAAAPDIHAYTSLPVQPTSDHRPVVLACSVPLRPLTSEQAVAKPPFSVDPNWELNRLQARRLEILVGIGAFFGFTVPGRLILFGTIIGAVGGYLILKSLLG